MKTNKFFSTKLYIDGLKQLFSIAIDALIVLVIFCIVNYARTEYFKEVQSVAFIFSEVFYISFMPLMTFYILRFAHKRNSSDFYYSLPYSRSCISLSYLAAVITYSLAYAVLILYGLPNKYNIASRFTYFIGLLVVYLLMNAVIYLAWSLTNTIFSHIVLSVLILLLPQCLITLISNLIYEICTFLDNGHKAILLDGKLNLLTHNLGIMNNNYDYVPGIIYTFILAIIYFILAFITSNKKLSENAGSETTNRIVHTLIRYTFTIFLCFSAIEGIIKYIYFDRYDEITISEIIITYAIALFAYFMYEFISTKSFRSLKKAIPGILILAIVNISIIVAIISFCNYVSEFKPTSSDIDYVMIDYTDVNYRDINNYYSSLYKDICLNDSESTELISETLNKNISTSKNIDSIENLKNDTNIVDLDVVICINDKKHYRSLLISDDNYEKIFENFKQNEDFIKKASVLPKKEEIDSYFIYGSYKCDENKLLELYEIYADELISLNINEQYEIIENSYKLATESDNMYLSEFNKKHPDLCMFSIEYKTQDKTPYNLFICITNKTPKAYAKYQEIIRKE